MVFDVSTLLTIILEGVLFAYYTNNVLYLKKSVLTSNLAVVGGYIILWIVGLFNIPTLNAIAFTIINFLLIHFVFDTNIKNTIAHTIALTVFMMIADFFVAFIMDWQIKNKWLLTLTQEQNLIQMIGSKLIYFIAIIILKYLIKDKNLYKEVKTGRIGLMVMPVSSIMLMLIVMKVMPVLLPYQKKLLILLGMLIMISNVVVFWLYDSALRQSAELADLQKHKYKSELELESYKRIKQKYDQDRIIRHDLREHLAILETLIQEEPEGAVRYLHDMAPQPAQGEITAFSDSNIFNILLSQKIKDCEQKGIRFEFDHNDLTSLGFLSDIDIVSVFSNLLNNAIEASAESEEKFITMKFFKKNNRFVAEIRNSAKYKPTFIGNLLKTSKKDKEHHGIGMKSINEAAKRCGGSLDWNYDEKQRVFEANVTLVVPEKAAEEVVEKQQVSFV